MKDKVAITYGWNRLAYIIRKSLNKQGVYTHIGDQSPFHMNSFLKKGQNFQYPSFYANPDKFVEFLLCYLQRNNIKKLISCHEETFVISKHANKFKENGIRVLVPDFESLKIAHKKNKSSILAKKLKIPLPETIAPISEAESRSFFKNLPKPIVLKYVNTNSSKGVFYLKSSKELEAHLPSLGDFILQEHVSGSGYGVSMLYQNGQVKARFTHKRLQEKLLTGGTSTLRESTRNELLEDYATRFLNHLDWNGVAMVEFKYDKKRKKGWFIEVNPRYWGSLALPYHSGLDFPHLHNRILNGEEIKPHLDYKTGVRVKWLLGSAIGFASDLLKFKKFNPRHFTEKCDFYDDFSLKDPLPFLGECSYYGFKFLKSFNFNPSEEALLKIDEI